MFVGLREYHHYNGKCVHLVRAVNEGEIFPSPTNSRKARAAEDGWICVGDFIKSIPGEDGWCSARAKNLIPLDGHDFTEEEREKEKEL